MLYMHINFSVRLRGSNVLYCMYLYYGSGGPQAIELYSYVLHASDVVSMLNQTLESQRRCCSVESLPNRMAKTSLPSTNAIATSSCSCFVLG